MPRYNEDEPTSIPTRAIHEAHLDVQGSLKEYRRATDRGHDTAQSRAHGHVQESVLTLWDFLRPHIRHNNAVEAYWDGKPPRYRGNEPPDPDAGKAILAWQIQPASYELNGTDPTELKTRQQWHNELDLADSVRIHGIAVRDGFVSLRYQTYEMGLRKLDSWSTDFVTVDTDVGGFMGGKTRSTTQRQRVPISKLKRAAHELSDVMDRLGLHARVETDNLPTDEL